MNFSSVFALALLLLAYPAAAGHPGNELDEVMAAKEPYFQAVDESAPGFTLVDAKGRSASLSDYSDKVVILNFIFASCTSVCPLHSQVIAEAQSLMNAGPMRDMVQFISVTTDPRRDGPDVLEAYADKHDLQVSNWIFLTSARAQPESATRDLAGRYGLRFDPQSGGQQMHGVVTFVVDRGGRLAAKFHGLRFKPLNLVLYVNGLTNAPPTRTSSQSWWERAKSLFH